MELIRKLGVRCCSTGKSKSSWGLFFCSFCNTEVERMITSGRRSHSCGCAASDIISTHGATRNYEKHPLYVVWTGICARCSNENHKSFHRYGGRGISVCDEWSDYTAFSVWALSHGWIKGLHVDRIKNNLPYSPDNCQILTNKENCRKNSKCILSYDLVAEIKLTYIPRVVTYKMLAEKYGVSVSAISRVVTNKTWA